MTAIKGNTGTLTWSLNNGTLTIKGKGAIPKYNHPRTPNLNRPPWEPYKDNINTIIIEDGVTSIGNFAFTGYALTSIVLPNSVTEIKYSAFKDCTALTSVTILGEIDEIEWEAFSNTGLTSITIPVYKRSEISVGAFQGCSGLTSFIIDERDNTDNRYFSNDGVLFFENPDLDAFVLEKYPEGKKGDYEMPKINEIIGGWAFCNCLGLTSVVIHEHVKKISENSLFKNCPCLTTITVDPKNRKYASDNGVLFNKKKDKLIRYPEGRKDDYVIPASVTKIGSKAFELCKASITVSTDNPEYENINKSLGRQINKK